MFTIGEFQRLTGLQTTLSLLEQQGKAQLLSNPKILAKNGTQAQIIVGGEIPYPATNSQGVSAEFKKYGIILNVLPIILPEKGGIIDVQIELEVSGPDFGQVITIGNTSVPSITSRKISNEVEMRSGETLVIGGLKSSSRNINIKRVPLLGRIPLLGGLFRFKEVREEQRSLFLFLTVEIVK
jgi:type II secretory pathway component GspD/PulD (secretin)